MIIHFDMGSGEPIADGPDVDGATTGLRAFRPEAVTGLLSVAEAEAAQRPGRRPHPAVIANAPCDGEPGSWPS